MDKDKSRDIFVWVVKFSLLVSLIAAVTYASAGQWQMVGLDIGNAAWMWLWIMEHKSCRVLEKALERKLNLGFEERKKGVEL